MKKTKSWEQATKMSYQNTMTYRLIPMDTLGCLHIHTDTCKYVCIHTYMYIYRGIHADMCIYMRIHANMYIYKGIHTDMYGYLHNT